jgi:hypothetical protein
LRLLAGHSAAACTVARVESVLQLALNGVLYGFLAWVVLVFVQLSDLFSTLFGLRGAHDYRQRGRQARQRTTEYFLAIPVVLALLIIFALGIDYAGRLLFDKGHVRDGLIVLVVLVFFAFFAGLVIVYLVSRAETPTYATLRSNLIEDAELRLTRTKVEAWRAQLGEIDAKDRQIRLGVRDRAVMRRTRLELREIAERFREVPPAGLDALRAIRLPYAWAYLWRGNALRVVPPLLAVLLVAVGIAITVVDPSQLGIPASFVLAVAVSGFLAVASSRASLASKAAWHAVNLKQRAEAEDLLLELERSTRKGVTGLGDRVTRALQILREQEK